jgi:hypothetical protein
MRNSLNILDLLLNTLRLEDELLDDRNMSGGVVGS